MVTSRPAESVVVMDRAEVRVVSTAEVGTTRRVEVLGGERESERRDRGKARQGKEGKGGGGGRRWREETREGKKKGGELVFERDGHRMGKRGGKNGGRRGTTKLDSYLGQRLKAHNRSSDKEARLT